MKQAELLAEYLSHLKLEAVYSSPLKRAIKTAEIIADYHKLGVETAPELIDFNYGEWQGRLHQEVKDKYKELYARWINSPEKIKIPAGESLNDVRERALNVVNNVVARYKGTVALVSHRVVKKVLICALLGLDFSHFWNIKQDAGAVTTFTYQNERFTLTEHNNTSYLKPIHKAPLSDF
jgi:broad specificity phosphatase PhoE|tara:strand:+ start:790 stop:1326 length:537 start_codon:yes stop_codon:yes gene_type:complete